MLRKRPGIQPNQAAPGTPEKAPQAGGPEQAVAQAGVKFRADILAKVASANLFDTNSVIRNHLTFATAS
jgi:hypothetical protein